MHTYMYQLISWGKCFEALICLFTIGVHKRNELKEIEGPKNEKWMLFITLVIEFNRP